MKGSNIRKTIAGIMSIAMTFSATSAVSVINTVNAAEEKVVYDLGFESEDDLKNWSNRGGDDTTELSITKDAKTGDGALLASGRSESWNCPAFRLDGVLEPNTQYYVTASVKGKYYTSAMLSFQYTIDGQTSYSTLA